MVPDTAFIIFASVVVSGDVELERGDEVEKVKEEDETGCRSMDHSVTTMYEVLLILSMSIYFSTLFNEISRIAWRPEKLFHSRFGRFSSSEAFEVLPKAFSFIS